MDKGAINEGHVLLLPIEHYASSLACSANAWAEMQRYLSAFKACAASQVPDLPPSPLLSLQLLHCAPALFINTHTTPPPSQPLPLRILPKRCMLYVELSEVGRHEAAFQGLLQYVHICAYNII